MKGDGLAMDGEHSLDTPLPCGMMGRATVWRNGHAEQS